MKCFIKRHACFKFTDLFRDDKWQNSHLLADIKKKKKNHNSTLQNIIDVGISLVQWLRLYSFKARGTGLIPGWGTKIPHASWHGQNYF